MSVNLEKTSRIIDLFEIYGDLLAEKQKTYIQAYYLFDLSLSEIAEEYEISRASVLDTLKQGLKKLEEFGIIKRNPTFPRAITIFYDECEKILK